jgi:glutamate dehydrogenase
MIFKAYFLAMEVFNFEGFFEELESYDGKIDAVQQTRLYRELLKVLKRTTIWLLNHYPLDGLLSDLVHDLSIGVGAFLGDLTDCLDAEGEDKLAQTVVFYQNFGIEHAFAERCALLAIAANSPNIVLLASATGFTMREIGTLYFHLGSRFSFGKIRAQVRGIVTTSTWVNQQLMGLLEDLYNYQSDLTLRVISLAHENPKALEDGGKSLMAQFEIDHTEAVTRLDRMFLEANIARCQDVATLTVATRELRLLSQS